MSENTTINLAIPSLPEALRGGAWDRLRELVGERSRVQREAAAASRDQAGMPVELAKARKLDSAAASAAYRAGDKDPGPVNLTAAEARQADVQRRRSSARQAIAAIEREIGQLLEGHVEEFRTGVAERLTAAEVATADLARALQLEAHLIAELQALSAWVEHPTAKLRAGRTGSVLQRLDEAVAEVTSLEVPAVRERRERQPEGPTIRMPTAADMRFARATGQVGTLRRSRG